MNINQIATESLRLSTRNQAILAETSWKNLADPYITAPHTSEEATIELAMKRDKEIENGDIKPIGHQDLMNRLHRDEVGDRQRRQQ